MRHRYIWAVDNVRSPVRPAVTLTRMPTLTSRQRSWVRARRYASLALSTVAALVVLANVMILFARPSTFFGDGSFGLSPLPALFYQSLSYAPVIIIAAVILAGTTARAPSVDPLPRRLPMVIAVTVGCVIAAFYLLPISAIVFSLVIAVLPSSYGA